MPDTTVDPIRGLRSTGACPGIEGAVATRTAAPVVSEGLAALRIAAAVWWMVAIAGHVVFGAYIVGTYGAATT